MAGGLAALLIGGAMVLAWRLHGSRGVASLLGQALVYGCLYSLFSVGLVVVYRASRVINFAHGALSVVSYTFFWELLGFHGLSYWISLPATVVGGALLAALVELVFIRRFFTSARLIVAVVTIGLAQLLIAFTRGLPGMLGDHENRPGLPRTPFTHLAWRTFPVRFTGDYGVLVLLTVVTLGLLGAFFRFTSVGIAIRGASQNGDRASELGINVKTLSTAVWAIAGALAALGAALQVPINGYNPSAGAASIGVSTLVIGLAAAVVGGMDSIPMTVTASLGIAVVIQVMNFGFHQSAVVDVAVLLVIIVGLVIQRRSLGRSEEASTATWAATQEVRPVPAELARLPVVRVNQRRLLGVVAVVVMGYPFVMSPSQTSLGSLVFIDGMIVISLVVLTGWGGQISLGHYALAAVGAFTAAVLAGQAHLPFLLAVPAASLAGAAVAIVLGLTALRLRGLYLAATTLAFSVVMAVLLAHNYLGRYLPEHVGRPLLLFLKTDDNRAFYYLCLAALALTWWAAAGLRRSRTGRVLIAMRDNERSAQAFGVNLVRTRLAAFAISGFMAASAGALLAFHARAVSAGAFTPDQSVQIFLTAIIGGLGSIQGALLGAVYFAVVDFFVHGVVGQLLASSIGVLVVLYVLPGGLGALAYQGRDAVLRRVAIRRRIWVPSLFSDVAAAAGLTNRAPLAPRPQVASEPRQVPARYRQPSRIRTTGASQSGPKWTYG